MEELLVELADLLEAQNNLMERLCRLGREQLQALRRDDLAELQRITAEQEALSRELTELETRRLALQERLAAGLNLRPDFSLRELLGMPLAGAARLRQLAAQAAENTAQLRDLNEVNRLLINQSLAYVNRMLQAVQPREKPTYGPGGRLAAGGGSRLAVDCSV